MSEQKQMYNSTSTSAPLIYTITFKPNSANNLSPDLITYRGISNISITLSTGESCTVKQRGGRGARQRRNEYRKQKVPNGEEKSIDCNVNLEEDKIKDIVKPYNASLEDAKEKQKKTER